MLVIITRHRTAKWGWGGHEWPLFNHPTPGHRQTTQGENTFFFFYLPPSKSVPNPALTSKEAAGSPGPAVPHLYNKTKTTLRQAKDMTHTPFSSRPPPPGLGAAQNRRKIFPRGDIGKREFRGSSRRHPRPLQPEESPRGSLEHSPPIEDPLPRAENLEKRNY